MRFFLGLIGVILSILLVAYRVPVRNFVGQIKWAEDRFGSGGTYTLMVLVGIFGFFFSLTYMVGGFDVIFGDSGLDFFKSAG